MSLSERIATIVMLVPGAIWAGVIVAYAVERTNLWSRMPVGQYVVDFRRSLYRVDPMQPILGVISLIGAVVFALDANGTGEVLAWVGMALIAAVIIWSVTLMEPLNSRFRRLPEGTAPEHAERIRDVWRRRHLARTVAGVAALICLAIAATYP